MKSDIFKYGDYRSYLRDYANIQKKQNPRWSYGLWAKKLKLANTAVISNIINGIRNPGPRVVAELIKYFKFSAEEAEYFRNLVLFEKKKSDQELAPVVLEKLQRCHPNHSFHWFDDQCFQAISQPHYCTIRKMVNLADFKEDADWIHRRMREKVSKPEIKRAIRNLVQLELLARDEMGQLEYHSGSVRSSTDVASEALRQFHEGMITSAKSAIRKVPLLERDITGVTFSVKKSRLKEMKKEIERFRLGLMKKYETLGEDDEVYQLNVQLFPLTKNESLKEDENEN